MTSDHPRIFFSHIPKCAGTSLKSAVTECLYGDSLNAFKIDLAASKKASEIFKTNMGSIRERVLAYHLGMKDYNFGAGHVGCRPSLVRAFKNEWAFVTILRDPFERFVSDYIYNVHKAAKWENLEDDFDRYLKSKRAKAGGSAMLRYFSNLKVSSLTRLDHHVITAVNNLKSFKVVGTVERLDEWKSSFEEAFECVLNIPVKNQSPRSDEYEKIVNNRDQVKIVLQLCEPDYKLYNCLFDKK